MEPGLDEVVVLRQGVGNTWDLLRGVFKRRLRGITTRWNFVGRTQSMGLGAQRSHLRGLSRPRALGCVGGTRTRSHLGGGVF
jgi:hypothetical protein